MSALQATPGPWDVSQRNPNNFAVYQRCGGRVAYTAISRDSVRAAEGLANATLIAAAPDLYEAASAVLEGLNARIDDACASESQNVPVFRGIAALSDALAKARGEQSL